MDHRVLLLGLNVLAAGYTREDGVCGCRMPVLVVENALREPEGLGMNALLERGHNLVTHQTH